MKEEPNDPIMIGLVLILSAGVISALVFTWFLGSL